MRFSLLNLSLLLLLLVGFRPQSGGLNHWSAWSALDNNFFRVFWFFFRGLLLFDSLLFLLFWFYFLWVFETITNLGILLLNRCCNHLRTLSSHHHRVADGYHWPGWVFMHVWKRNSNVKCHTFFDICLVGLINGQQVFLEVKTNAEPKICTDS